MAQVDDDDDDDEGYFTFCSRHTFHNLSTPDMGPLMLPFLAMVHHNHQVIASLESRDDVRCAEKNVSGLRSMSLSPLDVWIRVLRDFLAGRFIFNKNT